MTLDGINHEAQVNNLDTAPRPFANQEDVAASKIAVNHREAFKVDQCLGALADNSLLFVLVQSRAWFQPLLEQHPIYEFNDDVGRPRQGWVEHVGRPIELGFLELFSQLL